MKTSSLKSAFNTSLLAAACFIENLLVVMFKVDRNNVPAIVVELNVVLKCLALNVCTNHRFAAARLAYCLINSSITHDR